MTGSLTRIESAEPLYARVALELTLACGHRKRHTLHHPVPVRTKCADCATLKAGGVLSYKDAAGRTVVEGWDHRKNRPIRSVTKEAS